MAFAFTLDSTVPAEGGLVSAGAGNIRNLTAALIERLNSFFVDANTSPLTGKSGAQMSDTTFTGLITVSPAVKAIAINNAAGGSNSSLFFGYPNDGSHASYIDFNGLWRLGQGVNAASTNALTIRDTVTATDVVRIDNSDRIFINGGGVTVSTGATAVQALTCTTLGPSGAITSSATGSLFVRSGASTTEQYIDLSNTTGRLLLGVESSVGGQLIVGSTGYATVLTSVGATVLQLGTNQVVALTISTSQVVTLANKLIVNQSADSNANLVGQFSSGATAFPIGIFAGETGAFFGVASNGQRGAIAALSYGAVSGRFYGAASGGTPASRSAVTVGTTIASFNAVGATGATTWGVATSGFQILANNNFTPTVQGTKAQITVIRTGAASSLSVITFTDTLADIFTSAQFEQGAIILGAPLLVGTAVSTGSAAGDIVLPNLNSIRAVNADGSTTLPMLNMDATNRTTIQCNSIDLGFVNPLTSASVGIAGGASALPANPTGYLVIRLNAGANANRIPYYN